MQLKKTEKLLFGEINLVKPCLLTNNKCNLVLDVESHESRINTVNLLVLCVKTPSNQHPTDLRSTRSNLV